MCKGDGLIGRREDPGAVVETGGSRERAEVQIRRDLCDGKGAVATVIW